MQRGHAGKVFARSRSHARLHGAMRCEARKRVRRIQTRRKG
jgi:hypothetical protein